MLLRISLIIAILAGIATIVVTQMQAKKQIQTVIETRDENIKGRAAEKKRADVAEKNLNSTSNTLVTTKATLAKTEETLSNTRQQLAAAEASIKKLDTDLKGAVAARNEAQQALARWDQLVITPEGVVQLRATLKKAEDTIAVLQTEREIFTRKNLELSNKLDELLGNEKPVELPAGTKGTIVAVDPKWNFVVLNIGKDKGLLERGVLMVHRDSKYLGKVRITEVLENRAIANVVPGSTIDEIQEGDKVLY